MSEIDQGGFVYPFEGGENNNREPDRGITRRDRLAEIAMQAMVTAEYGSRMAEEVWAKDAYKIADAMIEAGKQ